MEYIFPIGYAFILIAAAYVIFIIGIAAKKTNEFIRRITVAVCDFFPAFGLVVVLVCYLNDLGFSHFFYALIVLVLSIFTQIADCLLKKSQ